MHKKVLMLASVASMIDQFNMPNIRLLLDMGFEVHAACNFREGNTCDVHRLRRLQEELRSMHVVVHQWDCPRDVFPVRKCWTAYRQLWKLTGRFHYEWIHCHSPIGGALARLAAHRRGIRVMYTVHGFHFYQGAPFKNWLLYYPAEKLLAGWTDVLVTVNREDYCFAKRKFQAGKIFYIPGVGIDTGKYCSMHRDASGKEDRDNKIAASGLREEGYDSAGLPEKNTIVQDCSEKRHDSIRLSEKEQSSAGSPEKVQDSTGLAEKGQGSAGLRRKYGIPEDAMLLLSVGELSRRKNHTVVVSALAGLPGKNVYYLVCGQGAQQKKLMRQAAELGVSGRVCMPGFLEDVDRAYREADIFVFPSVQEGMPVALMEAMASGMPCVVSDIRGSRELIAREELRFAPGSPQQLQKILLRMISDKKLRDACGAYNQEKIRAYDLAVAGRRMKRIYADFWKDIRKTDEADLR